MSVPDYGTCPDCLALKRLRKDGNVGRHSLGTKNVWPPRNCDGGGQPPLETQAAQAGEPLTS